MNAPTRAGARSPSPVALYPRPMPLATRLFLTARWTLTPYRRIAAHLPPSGKILDLGCGHGLLSLTAALEGPDRHVLGLDHDAARVALAAGAARSLPNVAFALGTFDDPPDGPFDGIALIDVLHYFAPEAQESIVHGAAGRLAPGGTLLVREVDPEAGAAAAWNRWYERVATAVGFTRTARGAHHFRTRRGWATLLEAAGFDVTAERCSSALFADVLYVGTRRGADRPRRAASPCVDTCSGNALENRGASRG